MFAGHSMLLPQQAKAVRWGPVPYEGEDVGHRREIPRLRAPAFVTEGATNEKKAGALRSE